VSKGSFPLSGAETKAFSAIGKIRQKDTRKIPEGYEKETQRGPKSKFPLTPSGS
jgi:hypothetical protein